jgi:hypothetical protein
VFANFSSVLDWASVVRQQKTGQQEEISSFSEQGSDK